jgi:hypothetical protein
MSNKTRKKITVLKDNGGRRLGIDRRQYLYAAHIPERRDGQERRSGIDRRKSTRTMAFNDSFLKRSPP